MYELTLAHFQTDKRDALQKILLGSRVCIICFCRRDLYFRSFVDTTLVAICYLRLQIDERFCFFLSRRLDDTPLRGLIIIFYRSACAHNKMEILVCLGGLNEEPLIVAPYVAYFRKARGTCDIRNPSHKGFTTNWIRSVGCKSLGWNVQRSRLVKETH